MLETDFATEVLQYVIFKRSERLKQKPDNLKSITPKYNSLKRYNFELKLGFFKFYGIREIQKVHLNSRRKQIKI